MRCDRVPFSPFVLFSFFAPFRTPHTTYTTHTHQGKNETRQLTGPPQGQTGPTHYTHTPQQIHKEMVRDGIKGFYRSKIEEAEGEIHEKTQNLRRLEAQRNALNAKGRRKELDVGHGGGAFLCLLVPFFFHSDAQPPTDPLFCPHSFFTLLVRHLREELQLLQEPGSYVAEVVKLMGKTKVLVKVITLFFFGHRFLSIHWMQPSRSHQKKKTPPLYSPFLDRLI